MEDRKSINMSFSLEESDLYEGCPYVLEELEAKMKLFLISYLKYGVISRACGTAGIKRKVYETWRKRIKKFDEVFREIDEEFTDKLEEEANRRALEKSDSLLQFLLRARRPEKFNPTVNVDASVGGEGIKLIFTNDELSPEEKKLLTGKEE